MMLVFAYSIVWFQGAKQRVRGVSIAPTWWVYPKRVLLNLSQCTQNLHKVGTLSRGSELIQRAVTITPLTRVKYGILWLHTVSFGFRGQKSIDERACFHRTLDICTVTEPNVSFSKECGQICTK